MNSDTPTKHIGILTSGGDCPGLNAAIRGIGKTASNEGMQVIGFLEGFRGLMENRFVRLDNEKLSGILTLGGTILGTSRDKPHRMPMGGKEVDMTDVIVENYHKNHLSALICLGGGGTQKNAYRLAQKGLNIITLPKTIDNDVAGTDITFGFDTALGISVEAIDRLHSTAHSHHRIIIVEIMGHRAGWLALGAGIAGGADVILIPEIPYNNEKLAQSILDRVSRGKRFSIVAVAEGAVSESAFKDITKAKEDLQKAENGKKTEAKLKLKELEASCTGRTMKIAEDLQKLTGLESRVTILGHLQRGGTPSAADRLLATRLGTACIKYIKEEKFGIMVAAKKQKTKAVPLKDVVGKVKMVPVDHPWIVSARNVGTSFGD
ncbi:MAG: 6-phosphofructokinase [Bacteroidales bacterium]|nr:6-phosphofructokinase [Bacteroidales bacterium]MCF8389837.1 6-phosphofructokinase [Bacteroidales bacterium]